MPYNNAIGNEIPLIGKDTWTFEITNSPKPFTSCLKDISTSPFGSGITECTVNILVNGSVVKTATVSGTHGALLKQDISYHKGFAGECFAAPGFQMLEIVLVTITTGKEI